MINHYLRIENGILDWAEKQREQPNEREWLYLVSGVLTWKDGIIK